MFGIAPGGGGAGGQPGGAQGGRSINLDDIFADCFFGPSSNALAAGGATQNAAEFDMGVGGGGGGGYGGGDLPAPPASMGGGYDDAEESRKRPRPRGPPAAPSSSYGMDMGPSGGGGGGGGGGSGKAAADVGGGGGGGPNAGSTRNMTEKQKVERRERNREHAKRSRVRKKFLLESLQQSVNALQQENDKLRSAIKEHLNPQQADSLLSQCSTKAGPLIASDPNDATRILDDPDYSLVKALQTAQQNFVITDPSLPDNPIVFASQGFLSLTGYQLDQVLGRNCRFLQGPQTDPKAVEKIRNAVTDGIDASVCLLNYRIDGSTFWNQFFVAPLRDSDGQVVNYVGVQCKVSEDFARAIAQSEGAEKGGLKDLSNA